MTLYMQDSRKISMTVSRYTSTSVIGYVTWVYYQDSETLKYDSYGATENLQEIEATDINRFSLITHSSPRKFECRYGQ